NAICNCFVGYDCKHGAALAQYYIQDHSLPTDSHATTYINKISTNKTSTNKIDATTTTIKNNLLKGDSTQIINTWLDQFQDNKAPSFSGNKAFLYFIRHRYQNKQDYLSVDIKSSREKKNGGWSKSFSSEYISTSLIANELAKKEDIKALTGIVRSDNNYRHNITTFDLFADIINTQRCYWDANYHLDHPVQLGEPITAVWQWFEVEEGLQTLKLILDNPSENIEIIKAQPLCYYHSKDNVIGKIETNTQCDFEADLLETPLINEEQLPWMMSKLKLFIGNKVKTLPQPTLSIEIELATPIIHLHFTTPKAGQPQTGNVKVTFSYQNNFISYYSNNATFTCQHTGVKIHRNQALELEAFEFFKSHQFIEISGRSHYNQKPDLLFMLQGRHHWHQFLHQTLPELKAQGWQVNFDDDFYYKELATTNVFEAEIIQQDDDDSHDFFSLGLNLEIDGKKMPAFPILYSAIDQLPKSVLTQRDNVLPKDLPIYVDLDDGEFIALSYQSIKPLLDQFVELFMPGAINKDGTLEISRFNSHQIITALDDQGVIASGAKKLRELANKLKNFTQIKAITPPEGLNAQLREYQQQGVNWLQFLREYQLNGILADDMGLGKTIQALTHLLVEKQQGRLTKPVLIVAPTSVIFNWANEIEKFTPQLSYKVLHGIKRKEFLDEKTLNNTDIIITSYALIVRDLDFYQEQKFYYLILDEAHYIKNTKTKLYKAFLGLKAQHKLCLTGTPMENHLGEFWAQFNFLLPGFLGGQKQFTKLFRTPIEKHGEQERKALLNQRIKPFILRRTKGKIAKELPAKTEIIQKLRIEGKQAELYETVRLAMDERLKEVIASKGLKRSQIEILDALLKLRQVCNHPKLLKLKGAKNINQSAKLDYLMETLPEQIEEGRRVLIFSQFTSMLALIEDALTEENIDYVKLTGSTTNRQAVVDKFQQGDVPVFLISLRAGGVGLNLTAADTVIHFDPWWNPAVENQATDRAHRIGQEKPVFVYKLIIENSIEEKIQQIQQNKAELAKALLSEEVSDTKLTLTDDVLSTLLSPLS
ncbi:MAG: DEAD/DEAH box helicase, partial [Colwellia sp.]|nr:DEAD/DEAH box helicase [Colwellia sp.]